MEKAVGLMVEHVGGHKALNPILCFPGGKSKLARIMLKGQMIPPHRIYVEPFFGGGSVFFAKPLAEINVINDVDKQLIAFYDQFRELPKLDCDLSPDRERFYKLKERLKSGETLDPCDYRYLNQWSVNCKMESFSEKKRAGISRCRRGNPESRKCGIFQILRDFERYKHKLKHAGILSKDFREVIREYDSPETFHFIDPPYYAKDLPKGAHECHYRMYGGCGVSPKDVLEAVRGIRGYFMLTYPNLPKLKQMFWEFYQTEIGWRYSSGSRTLHAAPVVQELIITNYKIEHE